MATSVQSKVSSDVAADTSSADSLSFASLVCIQDQCSKEALIGYVLPLPPPKQDPEFVFGNASPGLPAGSSNKISPADLLFSNGQLLPQAIPSDSNRSQVLGNVSSKALLPPPRRSSSSSSRRSSDNDLGFDKAAKKPNSTVRNQENKDHTVGNRSFGQKFFKSFATPCRGCRALEPSRSMKVQTLQQENVNLH